MPTSSRPNQADAVRPLGTGVDVPHAEPACSFSDRKRAEDVARQELANSLPMPLSEVRWSLCPLGPHEYLAVISPRHKLESLGPGLHHSSRTWPTPNRSPYAWALAVWPAWAATRWSLIWAPTAPSVATWWRSGRVFVRVLMRGVDPGAGGDAVDRLLADAMLPDLGTVEVYLTGLLSGHPSLVAALGERLQRAIKPFPCTRRIVLGV